MSVISVVRIDVNFSGTIAYGQQFETASNTTAPGSIETKSLISGANTITVPTGATGVTLVPPDDNEETILLKKVTGDTGINLSMTDPMYLSLDTVTSFVLTCGGAISNFRLIWS